MDNFAIKITNLNKIYALYERNFIDRFKETFILNKSIKKNKIEALKNINLEIKRGDIFGVLGRNGSGKSTLLKVISGISSPTSGEIQAQGKIVPLLELGGGFNPQYTGRENVYFYCSLLGYKKNEIDSFFDEILSFSELGEFIDVPIKKYSSGMRARLNFSVSINIDPDILILDEVLAVGDDLFKKKCFLKMEEFFQKGKTIIFVSHNLHQVEKICNRACIMHNGEILSIDNIEDAVRKYKHYLSISNLEKKEIIQSLSKSKNIQIPKKQIVKNDKVLISNKKRIIKHLDIDILNYSIRENGINIIEAFHGKSYEIYFKAKFNEAAKNVLLGVYLYDEYGKDLSGAFSTSKNNAIKSVKKGDVLTFEKEIFCGLRPGLYGIRFFVRSEINNKIVPVSVIKNGLFFIVKDNLENYSEGPYRFLY